MKTCRPFLTLLLFLSLVSCHTMDDFFDHFKEKDEKEKSFKTSEINPFHMTIANENGDTPMDPEELVYENRKMNPVLAHNGHHLTLEEFDAVKGRLIMTCTPEGTRINVQLEDLIPYGSYTLWIAVFESPGFTEDFAHLIAEGTPGGHEGFRSYIRANSMGKAAYSDFLPKGAMSVFGNVEGCLLDEYELFVIGAYHIDGKTYGAEPGPEGTWVEQFVWNYKKM